MNTAIEIKKGIYWIGVNDRRTHIFENYWPLPKGVAYNSYVIIDEKVVVLDTVERSHMDQYLESLEAVLRGRKVDYLIINHVEPDHTGSIKALLSQYPETTVVGNAKTFPMLRNYYGIEQNLLEVKEGDTLNIGARTLTFAMAPMLHWPETMVTWCPEWRTLFSGDAFGTFGALDGGITDSIPLKFFESIGYLRNIVILTQPRDYVKHPNKAMPLIKISLRKHRGAVEAMMHRHVMYNEQTSYVAMAENEGRCLVIRPDSKLPIGHISHDPEEMQRVYDIGRETGLRHVEAMKKFLSASE